MMSRRGRNGKHRSNQSQQNSGTHENGRPDNRAQGQTQSSTAQSPMGQGNTDRNTNKNSFPSAIQPRRTINRQQIETSIAPKLATRKYQVVFFDTISQAKSDLSNLQSISASCDQLNIVVRGEGPMDDPDLLRVGKLFCGAAWALIHDRRKADGWYDQLHE